ncbi:uncharacterized protein V6R79_004292 [Siganus canaliculatus]
MDNTILQLKSFVRQRLNVVARDIMAEVEKNMIIAERQSEVTQTKEKPASRPHRETVPEKPVEEPPQTSFTVDHGDNNDAPPLQQKKQVSSAPVESNFSQSNNIPGPCQTPADGNSHKWNCLETDFKLDMEKSPEKQKKEDRKVDDIVFPSVQFLKDEDQSASLSSSLAEENSMDAMSSPSESHAEKQAATCSFCGKIYTTEDCLTMHLLQVHLNQTPCKLCGKKCGSIPALMKHVQLKHPLMHCCDICGRIVYTKRSLVGHKRIHNKSM